MRCVDESVYAQLRMLSAENVFERFNDARHELSGRRRALLESRVDFQREARQRHLDIRT